MCDLQLDKLNKVGQAYYDKFGIDPFFDGLTQETMKEDFFITKLLNAVENNEPDLDLGCYFPCGRNI